MANDRMFLRCSCGSEVMLAKHFGNTWLAGSALPWHALQAVTRLAEHVAEERRHPVTVEQPEYDLETKLNKWFDEHQFCEADEDGWYPAHPTLVFESDDWPEDLK